MYSNIKYNKTNMNNSIREIALRSTLQKEASWLAGIGSFVGAHGGQNVLGKSMLHSGTTQKRIANSIMEGNQGVVNKSRTKAVLDGMYSGTIDPDAHVIRDEFRHMGKALREKGVDLKNLTPEDEKLLHAMADGEVHKIMTLLPYSELGRHFFVTSGDKQIATLEELMGASKNLSKDQWAKINKEFKESSISQLANALLGREVSGFKPVRDTGLMTRVMDKHMPKIKEKFTNSKLNHALHNVSDKLGFNKGNLTPEQAKKLEIAGHAVGAGASFAVDPVLGAWNTLKPFVIAPSDISKVYTGIEAKVNYAKGGLHVNDGEVFKNNKVAGEKGGLLSDYGLSPAMGAGDALMYDMGRLHANIMREGKGKEWLNRRVDPLRRMVKSPNVVENNHYVNSLEKDLNADNFKKDVRNFKEDIFDENTNDKLRNAAQDLVKNRRLSNDALEPFEEEANKGKHELEDKVNKRAATTDFDAIQKTNDFSNQVEAYTKSLAIPGTVALSGAMLYPSFKGDFQNYKERRNKVLNQNLKKSASYNDNNNNNGQTSNNALSILSGGVLGAAGGVLHGENKEYLKTQNAHSIAARLGVIARSTPDEAKAIIENLKKDPNWDSIKDLPSIKGIESKVNEYVKRADDIVNNAPEMKTINKIHGALDKLKLDPEKDGENVIFYAGKKAMQGKDWLNGKTSVRVNPNNVDEVVEHIANGKIANKEDAIDQIKAIVRNHKQAIKGRVQALGKEFADDATNGELSKFHNDSFQEIAKSLKPDKAKVVGKGLLGAGIGAVGGLAVDKIFNETSKIHHKDDDRLKQNYNVTPWLAGGALAGIGAGHLVDREMQNFKGKEFEGIMNNRFISPHEKLDRAIGASTILNMPNAGEAAIDENFKGDSGIEYVKDADFNKIRNGAKADLGLQMGKSFGAKAKGGALGLGLGALMAMSYNEDKKNQISRANLLKQSAVDQNDPNSYRTTDALMMGGTVAAGAGLGASIGKGIGDARKLKLTPTIESLKNNVADFYDPKEEFQDFANRANTRTTDSLINSLGHFNAGKKILKDIDVNNRQNMINQRNELNERIYEADDAYNERKKQIAEQEEKLKNLSQASKESEAFDRQYGSTVKKIKMNAKSLVNQMLGKGPTEEKKEYLQKKEELARELEQHQREVDNLNNMSAEERRKAKEALDNMLQSKQELLDADLDHKITSTDYDIYKKTNNSLGDIEKEFKGIPRKYAIGGGAAGLGTGLIGALMIHNSLNKQNNNN